MTADSHDHVRRGARLRRLTTPAVLLAGVALMVAGCGGSSPKPKPTPSRPQTLVDVVAADNKICERIGVQVARIAPPAFSPQSVTVHQLPVAVAYLDKVMPLLRQERDDIRAVGKPVQQTATQALLYGSALATLDKLLADEKTARDAAASGSLTGFKDALRHQTNDGKRLTGLAVQTGLTTCASG